MISAGHRQLRQILHAHHAVVGEQVGQGPLHALHLQQIVRRFLIAESALAGDGAGEQRILGPVTQLFDDFVVEAFDGLHLVHRHVSDFVQGRKAFFDQHIRPRLRR